LFFFIVIIYCWLFLSIENFFTVIIYGWLFLSIEILLFFVVVVFLDNYGYYSYR